MINDGGRLGFVPVTGSASNASAAKREAAIHDTKDLLSASSYGHREKRARYTPCESESNIRGHSSSGAFSQSGKSDQEMLSVSPVPSLPATAEQNVKFEEIHDFYLHIGNWSMEDHPPAKCTWTKQQFESILADENKTNRTYGLLRQLKSHMGQYQQMQERVDWLNFAGFTVNQGQNLDLAFSQKAREIEGLVFQINQIG